MRDSLISPFTSLGPGEENSCHSPRNSEGSIYEAADSVVDSSSSAGARSAEFMSLASNVDLQRDTGKERGLLRLQVRAPALGTPNLR